MNVKSFDRYIENFIESLPIEIGAKVVRSITLLEMSGSYLNMPHSKKVADKLFELRTRGQQEVRIFYTFHQGSAILLHGFVKKSQKTPPKEIEIAQNKIKMLTKP